MYNTGITKQNKPSRMYCDRFEEGFFFWSSWMRASLVDIQIHAPGIATTSPNSTLVTIEKKLKHVRFVRARDPNAKFLTQITPARNMNVGISSPNQAIDSLNEVAHQKPKNECKLCDISSNSRTGGKGAENDDAKERYNG